MHTARFSIISLFMFIYFSGQSQVKRPDGHIVSISSIDHLVSGLMEKGEVTGLCLGIVNDNKPAYIKTYGYKNKPQNQKLDTATCFYAASLAKSLFAYLVMQLVDKGVIDLDTPLYKYLPKPLP